MTIKHSKDWEIHELRAKFGCSQETMGHIIGVSGRTVARWEAEENDPHFLAKQKIGELEAILKKMEGVIKNGKEKDWLNTPLEILGDKTPLEVIGQGPDGIHEISRLLGRLESGIAV